MALCELIARDRAEAEADSADPLAPIPPQTPATAERVILLFMQGGPSQLETFDPKPGMHRYAEQLLPESLRDIDMAQTDAATSKVMPPLFKFDRHGDSGLEVSEIFSRIARHADKLAVVRSCFHDLFIHGSALTLMHSGTQLLGHPSVGSWVLYGLGRQCDRLPAYVAMTDTFFRNGAATFSSGFLPAAYQGTLLRTEGTPIQNLKLPPGFTSSEQRRLLDQVNQWNRRHLEDRPGDTRLEARIANYELAFRMQTAAPELIDLSRETEEVRNLYGVDAAPTAAFGRMCLLARRMVERGVRYVHLVNTDWDAHKNCNGNHQQQARQVDQPIAALLEDLQRRGLLDSTLIVWAGEFGRSPTMQGARGRDHHPHGFSVWMAGGGVRGGKTIGATDDFGFHAVEKRVHVNDLHATMLSLLGLSHLDLTYLFEGRHRRLTDAGGFNDLSSLLRQ